MPEKRVGHLLHCWFNGIAFNSSRPLLCRKFDGGFKQQGGNTLAPVRSLDEQTGDGPDGLIIEGLEYARALESNVFFARRNRAPTDRLFLDIGD
ncbi:MAG TPA: hypothetical protein VN920_12795, partial [Pyrinomonadaceae bacterium]|nr:hypothetical protein [Pyrinomonadaceae bacterium]